jgi:hypothetical protein
MVALTGGAAAVMFGTVPLLHKSSKTAPAAMSAKTLVSASSGSKAATPAPSLGKLGAAGTTKKSSGTAVQKTLGGTQGALTLQSPGTALAALIPNAGNFQYLLKQLVCRILRRLGLNQFANALGCPP